MADTNDAFKNVFDALDEQMAVCKGESAQVRRAALQQAKEIIAEKFAGMPLVNPCRCQEMEFGCGNCLFIHQDTSAYKERGTRFHEVMGWIPEDEIWRWVTYNRGERDEDGDFVYRCRQKFDEGGHMRIIPKEFYYSEFKEDGYRMPEWCPVQPMAKFLKSLTGEEDG